MAGAPGWVRFGVSRAGTSGGFSREPLESVSAEEDLHKGLVGMGVPDVTPSMLKSALEVMKSCYDFNSIVSLESLAMVRKHFSIPNEYVLYAPGPEQRPHHPCPKGFSVSVDALEAGLRFPLHPVIKECLGWWRTSPSQVAPNSMRYLITFLGECK
ncbi:hypothetical protein BHM03_00059345, partial [Ensete ventricosum]